MTATSDRDELVQLSKNRLFQIAGPYPEQTAMNEQAKPSAARGSI